MSLTMTYLGHATIMVESAAGKRLIVDPWLRGNPGCPYTPETLPHCDVIAVTHAAWDHLGEALELLERFPDAVLLCARDVRAWAKRKSVPAGRIQVMVTGFVREEAGFRIRGVETHHGSFIDDGDQCYSDICLGYIISEGNAPGIWHMADTSIFSDLKLFGELYKPAVTLVPVGSAPGSHTEMSPEEAALAAFWGAPVKAVPVHYQPGVQDDLLERWQQRLRELSPSTAVHAMEPGSTLTI